MANMVYKNKVSNHKKGIHGIGILLIFIALLLISVTAAGFLIYRSNQLAQDGHKTFNKINNNFKEFQIVEVAGTDARTQLLTTITIDAKLGGNSVPLDMTKLSISLEEDDSRSILSYRNSDAPLENSNQGYITWADQEFGELNYTQNSINTIILPVVDDVPHTLSRDLDGDGADETIEICDDDGVSVSCPASYEGTHLVVVFSNGGQAYAALQNQDTTLVNVSTGTQVLDVLKSPITDGTTTYGYISLSGTTPAIGYELDSNIAITVYSLGYLLQTDLDDDGQNDYLGLNATHVSFDLSSQTSDLVYALGQDLSGGSVTLDVQEPISSGSTRYATLTMQGTTSAANTIDESVTVFLEPYHSGKGYFVFEHLIRDKDSINGYMVPGDVVRFYVESYHGVTTDDIIDIKIFYADADARGKKVYSGNTFPNINRVVLWPKP